MQHRRDGATHVFSSWRQETLDPYELGSVNVDDNIRIRGGSLIKDYGLSTKRATGIPGRIEGKFLVKVKFMREQAPEVWVHEDALTPTDTETNPGRQCPEVTPRTQPGALEGIDRLYFANACQVSAVVYGLYRIRDPDPANLTPMRDGDLNCVDRRVIEHFEAATRGQVMTRQTPENRRVGGRGHRMGRDPSGRRGARLDKILERAINVRDIAGTDLYNSYKYSSKVASIELTLHNGHA